MKKHGAEGQAVAQLLLISPENKLDAGHRHDELNSPEGELQSARRNINPAYGRRI
jgi:hypothetical protein